MCFTLSKFLFHILLTADQQYLDCSEVIKCKYWIPEIYIDDYLRNILECDCSGMIFIRFIVPIIYLRRDNEILTRLYKNSIM